MGTFRTSRAALLAPLSDATSVLASRSTIPVLQNLLLDLKPSGGTITGTDLDVETSVPVEGAADGEAALTLPGRMLQDVVKKLPDGADITITFDDKMAEIAAGRTRVKLQVLPAGDFPRMPQAELPFGFTTQAKALAAALGTVSFAISTEETRFYLNGIYFEADEGNLSLVTTDGHRLAKARLQVDDLVDGMPGIILPRGTVAILAKLLGNKPSEDPVEIGLSESRMTFTFGETRLVSKLIDGNFPDYRRVVPTGNPNRFRFDKNTLDDALGRVSTVLVKGNAVKFGFGEDELSLNATNNELGTAAETLHIEKQDGDQVEIGFNARYCADMLDAMPEAMAEAQLGDAGAPALFRPSGAELPLFVLMPMRVP